MAHTALLDRPFGLQAQRWDSPIIILISYIVPDRVSVRLMRTLIASVGLWVSGSQDLGGIAGIFIDMRHATCAYAYREISTQREP